MTSGKSETELLMLLIELQAKRHKEWQQVISKRDTDLSAAYRIASKLSAKDHHFLGEKVLKLIEASERASNGKKKRKKRIMTTKSRAVLLAAYAQKVTNKERKKKVKEESKSGEK